MASTVKRRPLPALVSLLALLALTALVWWRVLHRSDSSAAASCPTPSASVSTSAAPAAAALPPPSAITVTVLNATKRAGIAGTTRKRLGTLGFRIPAAAGNDSPKNKVIGIAQIRYGPKGRAGAKVLRYYFPGATLRPIAASSATVVVALGPKYRNVAPAATVRRALRADRVVFATTSAKPTTAVPSGSASPSC